MMDQLSVRVIDVITYSPGGAIAIAIYDSTSNCLTLAYEHNYYVLKL